MTKRLMMMWAMLLCLAGTVSGQQMRMTSTELIRGRETPELISDRVAIRLYLEALSSQVGTNPELLALRIAQIGLSPVDARVFESIVKDFAVSHKALIESEGDTGDQFTNHKDVYITSLLEILNALARDKFIAFVQGEKRGMQVSPFDVGLSPSVRRQPAPMEGHVHFENAAFHPHAPQPQGGFQMVPNYSTYIPQQTMTGTTFYAEVYISGNASCPGYPSMCSSPQFYHSPRATVVHGSYGGTVYGTQGCPGCFIWADNTTRIPTSAIAAMNSADIVGSYQTTIWCSGNMAIIYTALPWPFPWLNVQAEFAFSMVKSDHYIIKEVTIGPPAIFRYQVHDVCSTDSEPPDLSMTSVDSTNDAYDPLGWINGGFCFRGVIAGIPTPWVCSTNVAGVFGFPGALSAPFPYNVNYHCTNKDKGISGWPITGWPF